MVTLSHAAKTAPEPAVLTLRGWAAGTKYLGEKHFAAIVTCESISFDIRFYRVYSGCILAVKSRQWPCSISF
ncbi:hypothetical protein ETW24_18260 [Leisingera sp. NJS204]|nr:hypothetical protein ETW24_18260 [Leisingera sp. NJS204]